jgi:Tol biopolymer transport system component
VSADGRFVAFASSATHLVPGDDDQSLRDVFVRDLRTGGIRRFVAAVPVMNESMPVPVISADGRSVAVERFETDPATGSWDVYPVVYDVRRGTARHIAVLRDGSAVPEFYPELSLSADGRYVAFSALSSVLVPGDTNDERDVFVRDLRSNRIERASVGTRGQQGGSPAYAPVISADGRYVAFWSAASGLAPEAPDGGATDVFRRGPLRHR